MGLIDSLRGKQRSTHAERRDIPACDHRLLQPRWDKLEDMGHDELASSYLCEACGEGFGVEEGRQLREAASHTLRRF